MFHGKNREVHPFYVKSDWNPPVQPSVALESYLEEVKSQLAEIKITKPKNNLSRKEHEALTELKQNTDINLKKADKGSTTVVMNKTDKIREGQIQIEDKHNYRPLSEPMVKETHSKVLRLITDLQRENHNGNRNTRELNKLSVVHFKGSAQLTQFPPLLNINCTEAYLGPLYRSYVLVQILNCKIPERVLLNGAICKRFSKGSRW